MNPINSYFVGLLVGLALGFSLGFSAAILAVTQEWLKLV